MARKLNERELEAMKAAEAGITEHGLYAVLRAALWLVGEEAAVKYAAYECAGQTDAMRAAFDEYNRLSRVRDDIRHAVRVLDGEI